MSSPTNTSPENDIHQKRESCWPEILKRVPTTQLSVCLCVSKKWYNLITSSSFVSSHNNTTFKHSSSSGLFMLRCFTNKNPRKRSKEFYHICSDTDEQTTGTLETLENLTKKTILCPFKTRNGLHFRYVGSVNGVVFLSDDCFGNTYNFILWNPLVNCFVKLPKPRASFKTIGAYMDVFGVGYDGEKDDFKVVRVVYPRKSDLLDESPPRAELYSVKEGKWRWVSAENVEYFPVDKDWTQCFLKGSVHWVAFDREKEELGSRHKSNVLLLFNVETEKFLMMKLPEELREVCPLSLMVSECQGMLCVDHYVMTNMLVGELVQYNRWVKKEYNKGKSWCKVARIDLQRTIAQKAIYMRKNVELLASSKIGELVSYDPNTGNVVALAPGCPGLYDACSFVESLAFLNKDCKNKRRFRAAENENDSSDDEVSWAELESVKMGKMVTYMNNLQKFQREF